MLVASQSMILSHSWVEDPKLKWAFLWHPKNASRGSCLVKICEMVCGELHRPAGRAYYPVSALLSMKGCRWSARRAMYLGPFKDVSKCTRDPNMSQLSSPEIISKCPPAWAVPCWHDRPIVSLSFCQACKSLSAQNNWKWDSLDHEICFQSSVVQCQCSFIQLRLRALWCGVSNGTLLDQWLP